MEFNFFLKGFILGFAIAAAVGPIGILCIRKTFEYGRLSGLFSGLGAAFADTVYGLIAAFGLTLASEVLMAGNFWLRIIGGAFLLYLGTKTFFAKPIEKSLSVSHKTLFNDFVTTFFLTIVNPSTILSFLAFFAGAGIADATDSSHNALWLVFGVFLGSALWWVILSEGVTLFRHKINPRAMIWINRISGLAIGAFGIASVASIFI